jgi:serine/threonine protein phosphatase PrpC
MQGQTELKLDVAALSDVGCQRGNNEDSFGYDLAAQLFVVCDGMGGVAAGELASSTAVAELLKYFSQQIASEATAEERLYSAILYANERVCALASENEELQGMGTTLVAACVDDRRLVIGNVGDSRAYYLRDGGCAQVTLDHSFVAEQVRMGAMNEEQADASPLKSLITRAIGQVDPVEPDIFTAPIEPGDILLLTSDGLTRYANAETIAELILGSPSLEQACQALIDAAKAQGAVDNVTCVLVQFGEEGDAAGG